MTIRRSRCVKILLFAAVAATPAWMAAAGRQDGVIVERFERDPGWERVNNRASEPGPRAVRQEFGYSRTAHAGGNTGEVGGCITPDARPAWYAARLARRTLDAPLEASGRFRATSRKFHLLLGLFNHATVREWRTPNSLALRLQGRGAHFFAYLEYATGKWRAGGDSPQGFTRPVPGGRPAMIEFDLERPHQWSLRYDPAGNGGAGRITARIDDAEAVCDLTPEHRQDGAAFDRFGLLNVVKSADDGGEVWIDDLALDGQRWSFDQDPAWEGRGNRRSYLSTGVRPRFDFGWSPTHYTDGRGRGELGGTVYRGDGRYPARMAAYGKSIRTLSMSRSLVAEGRLCLRRGVSDSTTLLGYYNRQESLAVSADQSNGFPPGFVGFAVEGPSSEGFFAYPVYRLTSGQSGWYGGPGRVHVLPDGRPHTWRLEFIPGPQPALTLTVDGRTVRLPVDLPKEGSMPALDRFGLVTTRIDGNAQEIYFDDLKFTGEPSDTLTLMD